MSIPSQISWLIPTLIPFLLGIGIGVIAKKVLKIAVAMIAVLAFASWVGYTQFPSISEAVNLAQSQIPVLKNYVSVLPLLLFS